MCVVNLKPPSKIDSQQEDKQNHVEVYIQRLKYQILLFVEISTEINTDADDYKFQKKSSNIRKETFDGSNW